MIIRGFDRAYSHPVVTKIWDELKPEYCLHVVAPQLFPERPRIQSAGSRRFEEIDAYGLVDLKFPDELSNAPPLSEAFLHEMAVCENATIKMMDRMDPTRVPDYEARKVFYHQQLRYWDHFLKSRKITIFLSHTIPHHPIDIIIYDLCKKYGIATIYFEKTPIGPALLCDDWKDDGAAIRNRMEELRTELAGDADITLADIFERHFQSQRSERQASYLHIDHYYRVKKAERSPRRRLSQRWATLKRMALSFATKPWESTSRWLSIEFLYSKKQSLKSRTKQLRAFYDAHRGEADHSKKYVFFPLHLQPEATTSPMGDVFNHQELAIEILSHALPPDWLIYVKDYDEQTAQGRTIDFYRNLLKLPNVRLIERTAPAFDLVRDCQAVATITGTAGWEGVMRDKPVLLFGHCLYQFAPGVFRIKSLGDAEAALRSIRAGHRVDVRELRLFLRALQEESFNAFTESHFVGAVEVKAEENSTQIYRAILRYLQRPAHWASRSRLSLPEKA